ncbi:MAG: enoyl-CoA hydratase/isomerase family protein [Canibacter sp.]
MQHNDVLIRPHGSILRITLNRPRAINALTTEMCIRIRHAIERVDPTETTAIVIDGAGDRGLCGGGDIKRMNESYDAGIEFLTEEYRMDYAAHISSVPVVGFMSGVTMGGGIGLTGHAAFRVVSERSRLAMPEARIGIMPDVGGHLLLSRIPGRLGELLAITAGTLNAADALYAGFADAYVSEADHESLIDRLAAGISPQKAIDEFRAELPTDLTPELFQQRQWWEPLVHETEEDLWREGPVPFARGVLARITASSSTYATETLAVVRTMCPVSVVLSLAQLQRTRNEQLTLQDVLNDDLRILSRLIARPDFAEGVRALLIEKDNNPGWQPASIDEITSVDINELLAS